MKRGALYMMWLCVLSLPLGLAAQSPETAARELLVQMGMEEIRVAQRDSVCTIAFEDHIYRARYRGMAEIIEALRSLPEAQQAALYELVLLEEGVPRLALSVPREIRNLQVSYRTDRAMRQLQGAACTNRQAGRMELVLYPELFLQNSWLDKLYGTAINLSPALEMDLWRGAHLTGQAVIPLYTNMTDEKKYLRVGILALRQEANFGKGWFGHVAVGNFTNQRMGVESALTYRTPAGAWLFGAKAALTGSSTWYGGKWIVSRWRRVSGAVWMRYNEPRYRLQIEGTLLRYVYGDWGGRLDVFRRFGEVAVGVYGMLAEGEVNGGFRFSIPLLRQKRHARSWMRVRLPNYFDYEYMARHGGAYYERVLGRNFTTRPDANTSRDFDSSDWVKREILNNIFTN